MQFIEKELIPQIEKEVAADTARSSRVIFGHSFGGLFAAYAFTEHNNVFGNYLMLSPSIWYDNEVILQYEKNHRDSIKNCDQLVFLGIGQMENGGRMQAPFEAFYQQLCKHYSSTKLQKNSVSHLDHVGSKNPNIEIGLDFYFQHK
jgi:predicted alpha/beta superfamily hydrolase